MWIAIVALLVLLIGMVSYGFVQRDKKPQIGMRWEEGKWVWDEEEPSQKKESSDQIDWLP